MAVKSVVDIEVNDGAFQNFSSMFEKYKAALGQLPDDWKAVGKAIDNTGSVFEQTLAALLAQRAIVEGIAEVEKDRADEAERRRKEDERAARSGAMHWRDMLRTTRGVAANVGEATKSLLRWSGIVGLVSGVLGIGGLWGINRMATGVVGARYAAQGLGISHGERRAFDVNYGTLVDTDNFLGSVSAARHSWEGQAGFFGAGLSARERSGSTADVGAALLDRLKTIADTSPEQGLINILRARSLDQFVSIDDMLRLKAMTGEEFDRFKSGFATDRAGLNIESQTQNAWVTFTQQLERASEKLKNTFVEGLSPLAPQLGALSAHFTTAVNTFAKSDGLKKWMDLAVSGLREFAEHVGTEEFQKNLETIANGFGWLATKIVDVLKFFGRASKDEEGLVPAASKNILSGSATSPERVERIQRWRAMIWGTPEKAIEDAPLPADRSDASVLKMFEEAGRRHRVDPRVLDAIYTVESSRGANVGPSSKGAVGPMQLMPATAESLGVRDPYDLAQSIEGAAKLMRENLDRFGEDYAKAIAAYNWNPTAVESYVDRGRYRTLDGSMGTEMPDETVRYLAKISDALSKQTGKAVTLKIMNEAGGNVIVQTSTAAAP